MVYDTPYMTSRLLDGLPWLAHGFGTAAWTQAAFERWADAGGWTPVIMNQVHGDTIHVLSGAPAARLSGDGLVTSAPGLCLVVRTADCLPVLLADPELRLAAAVHCGWRSTQKRILARAVDVLAGLGADPGRLLAAFGPSIGAACYEVGPEVREAFAAAGFPADVFRDVPGRPRRAFLDLRRANAGLLAGRGVPAGRIASDGPCTHCEPALLSHRRDPAGEARMINFIGIPRAPRGT